MFIRINDNELVSMRHIVKADYLPAAKGIKKRLVLTVEFPGSQNTTIPVAEKWADSAWATLLPSNTKRPTR